MDFYPQTLHESEGQIFESVLLSLYSQNQGRPVHVEGDDFDRIVAQFTDTGDCTFLQESGGTCTNILKTVARFLPRPSGVPFDSLSVPYFTGTVGGSLTPPRPDFYGHKSIPNKSSIPATYSDTEFSTQQKLYRDSLGLFFQKQLGHYGIQSALRMEQGSTGRCLVVPGFSQQKVAHAEKNILPPTAWIAAVSPGVSPRIAPEQIVLQELQSADCCVIEGMQLGSPDLDELLVKEVLQKEKYLIIACGTPWGAQAAAHFIQQHCIGTVAQKYKLIVFSNNAEGRTMEEAGINFFRLTENPMWLFVVTHDCGGSSVYFNRRHYYQEAVTPTKQIVDSTGAGDVFAGTCLAYWASSITASENLAAPLITEGLREASVIASRILQYPLCQTSFL